MVSLLLFFFRAALKEMEDLLNNFLGNPEERARIYATGSYKLGVVHADSDMDIVCVIPQNKKLVSPASRCEDELSSSPSVLRLMLSKSM